jgi:serine phosphatase RsbU (regulator of sigma subunit)
VDGGLETAPTLKSAQIDRLSEEALDIYASLGHLFSLELEDVAAARVRHLDPQALRAQYYSSVRDLLQALARRRPLILILENLHWADPSSTDLLTQLLSLTSSVPLLFCLATRPDHDAPGWRLVATAREILGDSLTQLTLDALSEVESRQLVCNLLDSETVPEQVWDPILATSEGNPLFVEEVIRTLIDRGAIVHENRTWVSRPERQIADIPDNLQGLLLARIDRLPEELRYVLRVAAVIGRQFPVKVLEQVLGERERGLTLLSNLSALESGGLIRVAQVVPDLAYRFRNVLTQDAAYVSILSADRQRLHLAVAQMLEDAYPERRSLRDLAPTLAQHYARAFAGGRGEPSAAPRALEYYCMAGGAALGSFANAEAERHYRSALALTAELGTPEPERAALLSSLGEAQYRQSRFKDAITSWKKGIALYQAVDDADGVARLFARSARAAWYDGDRPEGLRLAEEGMEAVIEAPESSGKAILVHETARAYFFSDAPADQVRSLCQQALEMAERLSDAQVQAEALSTLGILSDQSPDESLEALTRAVELAESNRLLPQARRAHNNLATVMEGLLGDFAGAHEHYERSAKLSRQTGNVEGEIIALSNMVSALLLTGEFAKVEATLPVISQLLRQSANPDPGTAGVQVSQASLLRYRGELPQAVELLRACHARAHEKGDPQHQLLCSTSLAEIALDPLALTEDAPSLPTAPGEARVVPSLGEAEAVLTAAVAAAGPGLSEGGLWPRCLLTMLLAGQGRDAEAQVALAEAQQMAARQSTPLSEGQFAWAEAKVAASAKRWDKALTTFETAAGMCARLGMRWWWARALLDWAETHTAHGEPTDLERARALLRESLGIFQDLGAPLYASYVDHRLAAVDAAIRAEMQDHGQVTQELAAASRIQGSFLPSEPPQIPGWQLAAALEPARETSGDFYDFIPLPNGRWGILIADVADKGIGAALYMALTRTLIRTYAVEYHWEPELMLQVVNRRILAETFSDMFVTAFYGVLDPFANSLTYCNAGHVPPFLLRAQAIRRARAGMSISSLSQPLRRTGLPLGILESANWGPVTVQFTSGDLLVLYTDGITEAHNAQEELFEEQRLLDAVQANVDRSAQGMVDALLARVHEFVGEAPQFDDITLMMVIREPA